MEKVEEIEDLAKEEEKELDKEAEAKEAEDLLELDATKKIKLSDGTVVSVGELLDGYMRQSDYTTKTQEIAELRRQLELARENILGRETSEEEKSQVKDDFEAQKKEIEEAISQLDELDPQAKVLKGLYRQINSLISKVETYETDAKKAEEEEAFEKEVANFQKLTKDIMVDMEKEFNFPKFKSPQSSEEIDFKKEWERDVYTVLSGIDENLTIPEYRNLVRKVGQEVYKRQRDKLSAISAHYAQAKTPATQKTKPTGEEAPKTLTLEDKIANALEKLEKKGE